ncbi:nuclear transport factor 2 family protein [Variovorax saccharolyticus]|uniref:nuclear transport factor 2 family protein n=1 Tax=Variovorax saccharolyticus TaxID=3053516 RepID=UPI002577F0ED|nr:nuclear transport factor 2 family protein [Variovorax sp. J22R187]MDM0021794.1 nuclear transport factor 2 family protein [Variovorax sp. J22R187]
MATIEERLCALEDRFAISELRSRYCWYTVRALRHEVVELFTEDGVFENARSSEDTPAIVTGRAALQDYFSRMRPARRIPLVTNEVTHIHGDQVEGTCAMTSIGEDPFCGHYIDSFRKVEGRWLFSARRFFPYWPVFKPDKDRQHP